MLSQDQEQNIMVSELDLPTRIIDKLEDKQILTAYDVKMGIIESPYKVLNIRGFGKITINKIKDALESKGIEVKAKAPERPKSEFEELGIRNSFKLALDRSRINSIDELISYMDNGNIKRIRSIGQLTIKEISDALYEKGYISESKKRLYYERYKLNKKNQNNAYVVFVDLKLGKYTYNAMYVKNDLIEDVYFKNRIPQGISKEKLIKIVKDNIGGKKDE